MRFILTTSLEPGMILGRDLVFGKDAFMLCKGIGLTENYIQRLNAAGYYGVYIVDHFSKDVQYDEAVDERLFQKSVEAVEAEDIGSMMELSTKLVSDITAKEHVGLDLYDLRSYDEYTYHHSVNVAIYSVAVGKKLGLSEEDLKMLCLASLTHDLGKLQIPEEILNKPGKLTDKEYDQIKMHPKYAFDRLQGVSNVPAKVRQAVLCHHENENGWGYPLGKSKNEIPYLAKIIHAVDVYDALTSRRSYKEPYASVEAFEYLKSGKNILFDESIVDAIFHVIPLYLPGTEVVLSSGEHALVVGHSANPKRPIIKLFENEKLVNLEMSLEYRDKFIVKSGMFIQEKQERVTTLNENRGENKAFKEVIMVVDDSYMTRMNAKRILEKEYQVETFQSGVEAICYIQEHKEPDLIIMDLEMPGLNGIDTIKTLRKNGHNSAPFIIFTSTCNRDTVIMCKELGAVDFIVKPVQPVYLLERVSVALKKNLEA